MKEWEHTLQVLRASYKIDTYILRRHNELSHLINGDAMGYVFKAELKIIDGLSLQDVDETNESVDHVSQTFDVYSELDPSILSKFVNGKKESFELPKVKPPVYQERDKLAVFFVNSVFNSKRSSLREAIKEYSPDNVVQL